MKYYNCLRFAYPAEAIRRLGGLEARWLGGLEDWKPKSFSGGSKILPGASKIILGGSKIVPGGFKITSWSLLGASWSLLGVSWEV